MRKSVSDAAQSSAGKSVDGVEGTNHSERLWESIPKNPTLTNLKKEYGQIPKFADPVIK
jgi:hypothetical protein